MRGEKQGGGAMYAWFQARCCCSSGVWYFDLLCRPPLWGQFVHAGCFLISIQLILFYPYVTMDVCVFYCAVSSELDWLLRLFE